MDGALGEICHQNYFHAICREKQMKFRKRRYLSACGSAVASPCRLPRSVELGVGECISPQRGGDFSWMPILGPSVCEFLMPLLSFSSFPLDYVQIVMTFFGVRLWEETIWQDFHVTNWVFWHVPCIFITLLTPINNDCFSFQWQWCEVVDFLMNKVVSWKWKQARLFKVCFCLTFSGQVQFA